jgi:hypothetical protein
MVGVARARTFLHTQQELQLKEVGFERILILKFQRLLKHCIG